MSRRKALVTLVIGDDYKAFWNRQFRPSIDKYAQRHGYDVVAIDHYIDTTPRSRARSPHWQKCLILEHPDVAPYDDVVWIDADILVNWQKAPCIVESNRLGSVGLVSHKLFYAQTGRNENLTRRMAEITEERFRGKNDDHHIPTRYEMAGLPGDVDDMTNTGVLVFCRDHRDMLRTVYNDYEENPWTAKENIPLSYHLFKTKVANPIDPRFNQIWINDIVENYPFLANADTYRDKKLVCYCVNAAFRNSYFHHYLANVWRQDHELVFPDMPSDFFNIK